MTTIPTPDREEIIKLRAQGMNREEIAEYYGVALSRVKRWIRDLNIPTNPQATSGKSVQKASEGQPLGADYGMTLIEKARSILGKRMGQDYRGYLLDGRPVRVDILIRTAGLSLPDVP